MRRFAFVGLFLALLVPFLAVASPAEAVGSSSSASDNKPGKGNCGKHNGAKNHGGQMPGVGRVAPCKNKHKNKNGNGGLVTGTSVT